MSQSAKKKRVTVFRVGEKVGVRLAGRVLPAVIIEDRGDLGPGGSRLLRVELKPKNDTSGEREQFEVPAQALVHP
jgi:hypothetical protein